MFAGMVVLLNQYLVANGGQSKPGLGNLNVLLYRIAQSNPAAFHDVTSGNNIVPCIAGSPDCVNGQLGYTAGPGFDLCTGLGSVDLAQLASAALTKPAAASLIVVSSNANPVYQQAPDFDGYSWSVTLTLTEEAGIATTLTGFSIDGKSETLATWFSTAAISPFGSAQTSIEFMDLVLPRNHVFAFTGADKRPNLDHAGEHPICRLRAILHRTRALDSRRDELRVFRAGVCAGNDHGHLRVAAFHRYGIHAHHPLPTYLKNFEATVNGVLTPIYYVSPTFANVQIPYGTAPGPATLVVYQGGQSASTQIQIAAAAPGIFRLERQPGARRERRRKSDSAAVHHRRWRGLYRHLPPARHRRRRFRSRTCRNPFFQSQSLLEDNRRTLSSMASPGVWSAPRRLISRSRPVSLPGPQPVVVTVGGVPSNTAIFTITH